MIELFKPGDDVDIEPICTSCLHQYGWEWGKCDAFPEGIPDEILSGEFDHHDPFGGETLADFTYKPLFENELDE